MEAQGKEEVKEERQGKEEEGQRTWEKHTNEKANKRKKKQTKKKKKRKEFCADLGGGWEEGAGWEEEGVGGSSCGRDETRSRSSWRDSREGQGARWVCVVFASLFFLLAHKATKLKCRSQTKMLANLGAFVWRR